MPRGSASASTLSLFCLPELMMTLGFRRPVETLIPLWVEGGTDVAEQDDDE